MISFTTKNLTSIQQSPLGSYSPVIAICNLAAGYTLKVVEFEQDDAILSKLWC